MNPYLQAQKPAAPAQTRIDLLLAMFDGALERITKAMTALQRRDNATAVPLLAKTQLIVTEMAAGVRMDIDPEVGTKMLQLYEFVVHRLKQGQIAALQDAKKILGIMREGFNSIREEAAAMERRGQLPALDALRVVHARA